NPLINEGNQPKKDPTIPMGNTPVDVGNLANKEQGNFMASKQSKSGSGNGNKSLYKHWKETLDDDYDPYDDDEYNAYGLPEEQEAFCDALDINIRGHRKK
ncbi:hypothetical protein Tco_1519031, partial [Tanacetum coccineum]